MARNLKLNIISLVLIFNLLACKDEDIVIPYFDFVVYSPGMQTNGSGQADVFDKTWHANAYIFPYDQDTQFVSLRLETYTQAGELRDELYFGNFPLKEGSYLVEDDASAGLSEGDNIIYGGYAQYQADGDVIYGIYELDDRYQANFYIDDIDTLSHVMKGRFDALFQLKEEYLHANLAKLIKFDNGEFTVNF